MALRVRPTRLDQPAVPLQDGLRGDQERIPPLAGNQPRQERSPELGCIDILKAGYRGFGRWPAWVAAVCRQPDQNRPLQTQNRAPCDSRPNDNAISSKLNGDQAFNHNPRRGHNETRSPPQPASRRPRVRRAGPSDLIGRGRLRVKRRPRSANATAPAAALDRRVTRPGDGGLHGPRGPLARAQAARQRSKHPTQRGDPVPMTTATCHLSPTRSGTRPPNS